MIGRASIGYPWVFREIKHFLNTGELLAPPTVHERVDAARQHLIHSIKWKGERLGIVEMRRHYTNYFRGFENIKHYRQQLVTIDALENILSLLLEIEEVYGVKEFA
jgi:tRNA-dihydrouridine synthase B